MKPFLIILTVLWSHFEAKTFFSWAYPWFLRLQILRFRDTICSSMVDIPHYDLYLLSACDSALWICQCSLHPCILCLTFSLSTCSHQVYRLASVWKKWCWVISAGLMVCHPSAIFIEWRWLNISDCMLCFTLSRETKIMNTFMWIWLMHIYH